MIIQKYVKVGETGQIAIPKDIREAHGIKTNQMVEIFSVGDGDIILRNRRKEKSNLRRIVELLRKSGLTRKDWKELHEWRNR